LLGVDLGAHVGFARADVGALSVGVLGWGVVLAVWDWWNSDHCLLVDSIGILFDLMGGLVGVICLLPFWELEGGVVVKSRIAVAASRNFFGPLNLETF
jgi:hypothetical protein